MAKLNFPRVLFIGKRFYTNKDAFEEGYGRIYQLPRHWSEAGINVELWLVDYHTRRSECRLDGSLLVSSLPVRLSETLWQLLANLFRLKDYTHVIASGDCYIGLLAYAMARRTKAKFVFDVYDKYDEFAGYRRFLGFDPFNYLLRHAECSMFASVALRDQLCGSKRRGLIVPNGLDNHRFRPLDMQQCRFETGLPEDVTYVGYFGGMEPDRGVTDLINAIQLLRSDGLNIELLIGGKRRLEVDLDAPGINYVGNVPFEKMPTMLCACNLLAVPYRRSAFMDAGASNKIAEALACQRPIVATRTPNLLSNFPEAATLLADRLAEPGNIEEIASAVRLQLNHPVFAVLPNNWDWPSIAHNTADQLGLMTTYFESGACQ